LSAAGAAKVTLVDADPMGAGIEWVIGLDEPAGAGWATLQQSAGRLGSRSLRTSLPRRGDLAVLGWGEGPRGDLEAGVVREVVSAAKRGSGLVVADLPRHLDTGAAELLRRCDALLVVTPLTLPAVAAAAHAVRTLTPGVPRAFLVARGPATGLDPAEVSRLLGVPLAAEMADQRGLAEAVELGVGPLPRRRGPLLRAVRTTLARVGPSDLRAGVPT
ncbi:MAG TPA: septum site-determining protein Ssd, partial [Pseudonocardia sp.]|nr:septum site-determining protein Ssd [Pseudonocardia sp.]